MKQFKTESKKIMDMMINSIYTNKDIFLRELISNASDALDKAYFNSLTNSSEKRDLEIKIDIDKSGRVLTITDSGVGMSKQELEENLGTIAKSGTLDFKKQLDKQAEIDVIGQFGVGFYSAFMVADKIEVISKKLDEKANKWTSRGVEGYELEELTCDYTDIGTVIKLYIKENTEDFSYDKYLEPYEIESLIKKYSDFIRYPIKMQQISEQGNKEYKTVNSMIPIWKKNKNEITTENYTEFYKTAFYDFQAPLHYLHYSVEGKVCFKALLYFPAKVDYNYYSKDYEKGLKLYTNGVLITDKYSNLLPDHFSFVKGIVDAELPLNVSRETLQNSKDVDVIASNIENKIKNELLNLLKTDRETYLKIYEQFGLQFKYSIYKEYGFNKEKLQDLLMFKSVKQEKLISLEEYVNAMQEGQEKIYYVFAKNTNACKDIPQVESLLDNNFDVLCLSDNIDELVFKMINSYNNKQFANALSEQTKISENNLSAEETEVINFVKETLKDCVVNANLSENLKDHPVGLSSEGEISIDMEKALKDTPNGENIKANKILQINKNLPIYTKLESLIKSAPENAKELCYVLYEQARLISGLELENPSKYSKSVCNLIAE